MNLVSIFGFNYVLSPFSWSLWILFSLEAHFGAHPACEAELAESLRWDSGEEMRQSGPVLGVGP